MIKENEKLLLILLCSFILNVVLIFCVVDMNKKAKELENKDTKIVKVLKDMKTISNEINKQNNKMKDILVEIDRLEKKDMKLDSGTSGKKVK